MEFSWFDEILYTDLKGDEAKEEIKRINDKGKRAIEASFMNRDKQRPRLREDYRPQSEYRRRFDERRRYDHRPEVRWYERRNNVGVPYQSGGNGGGGGGGMTSGGGNRWNIGGGNSYRNIMGVSTGTGYRDDRQRNYDHRQNAGRFGYNGGMGSGGGGVHVNQPSNNWVYNRHRNYDDRHNRYSNSGAGNIGRYDGYNSGGINNSRNYRLNNEYRENRDQRNNHRIVGGNMNAINNRRDNNYRSGNGSFNNTQRDFYVGHRDIRTDSRGGRIMTTDNEYVNHHHHLTGTAAVIGPTTAPMMPETAAATVNIPEASVPMYSKNRVR